MRWMMALRMHSPAFADGEDIPRKYTGDGKNISPPLFWSGIPARTRSLVLVMDDPDAPMGTFGHWALYDIPPTQTSLEEALDQSPKAKAFGHGVNDFGRACYDGPSPPKGHGRHRYYIRLAALDIDHLPIQSGASVLETWDAAKPHILDQAEIFGIYERR